MSLELIGNRISLVSLESEHLDALALFSTDPEIWKFLSVSLNSREDVDQWYEEAKAAETQGKVIPFVIKENKTAEIIGSTRLFDVDIKHKTAEMGWTWLDPKFFGQKINLEAKLLLLTYSFETLYLNRVQFKTDITNIRSQKALQKIGAKLEGTLRSYRIRRNGSLGDSLVYSIIISEWLEIKESIIKKLEKNFV
ncbi:GNAT family N-acetyltransferase [Chitinophaga tropicalis]|uniref:GNAT family N-acetyltransferase n=1 Tax=Chitinophaga tropicalis TaxID=2683588 RepID=A0A7K1U052_9BACT|nr:GNAT family protein [Chitinophaga tropicalis]MVT07751.1 GNAT family N-acetyltransferase [Chitinophaga tropicalis]